MAPVGVFACRGRDNDSRFCAAVGASCGFAAQVEEYLNPGYPLRRDFPELSDGLLIAVTERRTREHIDRLVELLTGKRPSEPAAAGAAASGADSSATTRVGV